MKKVNLYDNGYSYILVDKNSIQILKKSNNAFSPRSVKVWGTMQIELGRPVKELKDCLAQSRVPLLIKEVSLPLHGMLGYQLIRMHTGKVDDKVLANILEKDEKIIKLTFNRELINDMEFRKYSQLPAVNQFRLKALNLDDSKELEANFSKQLDTIIQTLFRGSARFIKADYTPGEINIIVDADGQKQKIAFLFSKKSGFYELVSISI